MQGTCVYIQICVLLTAGLAFGTAADPRCPPVEDPKNPIHYPHPTECSKFLTCSWGTLVEQNCPEGHLWNDQMKYCDYPENVDCNEMSTPPPATSSTSTTVASATPTTTTSEKSTTRTDAESQNSSPSTVPAPTESCPEVYDPYHQVYFPHDDCNKYYICTFEGNKLEQNCPAGLHWSQSFGYCNWPEAAECVSSSDISSTSSTTAPTTASSNPSIATTEEYYTSTSAAPQSPSTPKGKCPHQFEPKHQFAAHEDCTKFYSCVWGGDSYAAYEIICPAGLHWNQRTSQCDYPEIAGCVATLDPPSTASTTSTSQSHSTTTSEEATTSTTTESQRTTTTSTTAPVDKCPEVYDPNHQVYFPHVDCSKYYICTYEGNKLEQNCPAGLHWSQSYDYCDWPEDAECTAVPETTSTSSVTEQETVSSNPSTTTSVEFSTSTTTASQSHSPPTGKCPQYYDPSHHFAAHEDCTKFYVCVWKGDGYVAYETICPAGLHWNLAESQCDYPELAGCDSNPLTSTHTTTSTTTTPSTTTSAASSDKCPEVYDPWHQVYFPHVDCRKYYICTYEGNKLEQNCPSGLHWNQSLGYCDWAELTQCS